MKNKFRSFSVIFLTLFFVLSFLFVGEMVEARIDKAELINESVLFISSNKNDGKEISELVYELSHSQYKLTEKSHWEVQIIDEKDNEVQDVTNWFEQSIQSTSDGMILVLKEDYRDSPMLYGKKYLFKAHVLLEDEAIDNSDIEKNPFKIKQSINGEEKILTEKTVTTGFLVEQEEKEEFTELEEKTSTIESSEANIKSIFKKNNKFSTEDTFIYNEEIVRELFEIGNQFRSIKLEDAIVYSGPDWQLKGSILRFHPNYKFNYMMYRYNRGISDVSNFVTPDFPGELMSKIKKLEQIEPSRGIYPFLNSTKGIGGMFTVKNPISNSLTSAEYKNYGTRLGNGINGGWYENKLADPIFFKDDISNIVKGVVYDPELMYLIEITLSIDTYTGSGQVVMRLLNTSDKERNFSLYETTEWQTNNTFRAAPDFIYGNDGRTPIGYKISTKGDQLEFTLSYQNNDNTYMGDNAAYYTNRRDRMFNFNSSQVYSGKFQEIFPFINDKGEYSDRYNANQNRVNSEIKDKSGNSTGAQTKVKNVKYGEFVEYGYSYYFGEERKGLKIENNKSNIQIYQGTEKILNELMIINPNENINNGQINLLIDGKDPQPISTSQNILGSGQMTKLPYSIDTSEWTPGVYRGRIEVISGNNNKSYGGPISITVLKNYTLDYNVERTITSTSNIVGKGGTDYFSIVKNSVVTDDRYENNLEKIVLTYPSNSDLLFGEEYSKLGKSDTVDKINYKETTFSSISNLISTSELDKILSSIILKTKVRGEKALTNEFAIELVTKENKSKVTKKKLPGSIKITYLDTDEKEIDTSRIKNIPDYIYGTYQIGNKLPNFKLEGNESDKTKPYYPNIDFYNFVERQPKDMIVDDKNQSIDYIYKRISSISAEFNKAIEVVLGDTKNDINLNTAVKNVVINGVVAKNDEYDIKFTDNKFVIPSDYIQENTMTSLTISEKNNPQNSIILSNIPLKTGWGNTLFYMGFNGQANQETSGAFTLHSGNSPYITAVPGGFKPGNIDTQKVHSYFSDKEKYYSFSNYSMKNIESFQMKDDSPSTTTMIANGGEIVKDAVKKWGTEGSQKVNYGDIVQTWTLEKKMYLTKDGVRPNNSELFDKINMTRYFEVTNSGYVPLVFNILKTTPGEVSTNTTTQELDKTITEYINLDGNNQLTAKFKEYPDTSKVSDNAKGIISVTEKLTTGKSVSYDYDVTFKIINKWGEVPWEFDEETGILYLMKSGTLGETYQSPWKIAGVQKVDSTKIKKIELKEPIKAPINSTLLFYGLSNLEEIISLDKLDTTDVESMYQMFAELPKIKQLNISKFKTNKVLNYASMFRNDRELTTLDVSSFETSIANNFGFMFSGLSKLTELDLKNFQTTNVIYMDNMFNGSSSLKKLDISNFRTNKVNNMSNMFMNTLIEQLNLSHFNTNEVTNMSGMFSSMSKLTNLNLSGFNTSKVTNQTDMFKEDIKLNRLTLGKDIRFKGHLGLPNIVSSDRYTGSWKLTGEQSTEILNSIDFLKYYDGSKPGTYVWEERPVWGNVRWRFDEPSGELLFLTKGTLTASQYSPWNRSDVYKIDSKKIKKISFNQEVVAPTQSSDLFGSSSTSNRLTNLEEFSSLDKLDTKEVSSMNNMFLDLESLKSIDVSHFDTSKVTNFTNTFRNLKEVKHFDGSNFNTINATSMRNMFSGMNLLEELNISGFNTSKVTNQTDMFAENMCLSKLTLGKQFKFMDNSNLPNIAKTAQFSGDWETSGETSYIIGTSKEFMTAYDGSTPGTYVWQENTWDIELGQLNSSLGDTTQTIDLNSAVSKVNLNGSKLNSADYDISFTHPDYMLPSLYVTSDIKVSVTLTEKSNPLNKTIVENVPLSIGWGNSVFFMGYNGSTATMTSGAFTLHTQGNQPIITATPGGSKPSNPDKQKVHDRFLDTEKYYSFTNYSMDNVKANQSFPMKDNSVPTTTMTANGGEIVKDVVKKWGTEGSQKVNYGDIVQTWALEKKMYLTKDGIRPNNSDSFDRINATRYFEVTNSGYVPLVFNTLKTKPGEVVINTTNQELDKTITEYINLDGTNQLTAKFKEYPDTSKASDNAKGIIAVTEKLTSGKSVTYDYSVNFKVILSDINVTINYNQWMNNSKSRKKVIGNLKKGTRKESLIETMAINDESIKDLLTNNKKLQALNIKGYTFTSDDTQKISIALTDNPAKELKLSDKVPREDFTVTYYYNPTIQLKIPSEINFGIREKKQELYMYGIVPSHVKENNEISIIDTYETINNDPSWTLYASTEGFYNEKTGVRLLADIVLNTPEYETPKEITNESTPLFINDPHFEKRISLIDDKQKEGLFVNVSRIKEIGKYKGVLKYTLQATP